VSLSAVQTAYQSTVRPGLCRGFWRPHWDARECITLFGLLVFEDTGVLGILWDRKLGTALLLVVLYTFYDGVFRRGKSKA